MAGKARINEEYPLEESRVPLFVTFQPRDATSKKDQRVINTALESVKNPLTGNTRIFVVKRPALNLNSQPASGTGRGIHYWEETGIIYSIVDQTVYAGTSSMGFTVSAASGTVYFAETNPTDATQSLVLSDGTNLYQITSNHTITVIDTNTDSDFPTGNIGKVLYFDTYFILAKANGNIYNSDPSGGITSWAALAVQASEMYQDTLVNIARQKDTILSMGTGGVEMYFNNDTPGVSPWLRQEQNTLGVGIPTITAYAQKGDYSIWVAGTDEGGYSVWKMDALASIEKVSTDFVDKILTGETIGNCYGLLVYFQANLLYLLNCPVYGTTLVYDVEHNFWYEWNNTSNGTMDVRYSTEKNNVSYLQSPTTGKIYTLDPTVYQDDSSNFTVTIQLQEQDHDTAFRKFSSTFAIIGDTGSTTVSVSYSDDNYASYTTAATIDMSLPRKYVKGLGSYYTRSWKLEHTDNTSLRLEAVEETFRKGNK